MTVRFEVAGRIARPVHEVFEAVVNPDQLSQYFTTGGAKGRLVTGAVVTWDFHDFPGAFPVEVVEVEQDRRVVFQWDGPDDGGEPYATTVTMTFEALPDDRTLVTISEEGWRDNEVGRGASYNNCQGWSEMLCSMKAWIEHRIRLRDDMYV
jgi:uncharacterized protein YndB with AHSA1/START domain